MKKETSSNEKIGDGKEREEKSLLLKGRGGGREFSNICDIALVCLGFCPFFT